MGHGHHLGHGHQHGDAENGNHLQTFHLVRPSTMDDGLRSGGKSQWQTPSGQPIDRTPKAIPEIFLTRLLSTKVYAAVSYWLLQFITFCVTRNVFDVSFREHYRATDAIARQLLNRTNYN